MSQLNLRKSLGKATFNELLARAAELSEAIDKDDKPLMFCSAQELMSALAARCHNMVMIIQLPTNRTRAMPATYSMLIGDKMACRGLADVVYEQAKDASNIYTIGGTGPDDDDAQPTGDNGQPV